MKKVVSKLAGYTVQARENYTMRVKEGFDWSRVYDFLNNEEDAKEMNIKYPGLMAAFTLIGINSMPKVTVAGESVANFLGTPIRMIGDAYRSDDIAGWLGVPVEEVEELARRLQNVETL